MFDTIQEKLNQDDNIRKEVNNAVDRSKNKQSPEEQKKSQETLSANDILAILKTLPPQTRMQLNYIFAQKTPEEKASFVNLLATYKKGDLTNLAKNSTVLSMIANEYDRMLTEKTPTNKKPTPENKNKPQETLSLNEFLTAMKTLPPLEKGQLEYIITRTTPEEKANFIDLLATYKKGNLTNLSKDPEVLALIRKKFNSMYGHIPSTPENKNKTPEAPKVNENKKEFVYNPNYSPDKLNQGGSKELEKLSPELDELFNVNVLGLKTGRPFKTFTEDDWKKLDNIIKENNPVLNACILYKAMRRP